VLVAGCGASSTHQKPTLHASAEKRLLSLVARARVDATAHDGTAVHAVLGEFVSEIQTLKTSGQLAGTIAASLDHEAHTTAAQAAERLHPAKPPETKPKTTAETTTAATSTIAATPTTPAVGTTPTAPTAPVNSTPSSADGTPEQNDQGSDSQRTGHGHRYGAGASGWWTAVRNWIESQPGGGGGND
jgi:hypothetical protein